MYTLERASTGLEGLDQVIDQLRIGDNVVWQVDDLASYRKMAAPFVERAIRDGRRLVYVRFGRHEPVLDESMFVPSPSEGSAAQVEMVTFEPDKGFERFALAIHYLIEQKGKRTFYVFDCLTDLLEHWHSDLMIGNFFRVCCPYLFEMETIAYFPILRNVHTNSTIAGIRETTQVLLDVYHVGGRLYAHPLKALNRYSPTMFFPHLIEGQQAVCITASAEAAELFSGFPRGEERLDYWHQMFLRAREALDQPPEIREAVKRRLMSRLLAPENTRMFELCDRYFDLQDVLAIESREIGSGWIGGKSVGMLLARKMLEKAGGDRFSAWLEPHDSFYVGSDVFYTYIVQNGWWKLRAQQKTKEGYFRLAPELKEKLSAGRFPDNIREQFMRVLEYFGQSPIIVRSSSLLEDNFGNAFAGKYESVFCVNQGSLEERYQAFEQAIRTVYASTMDEDALRYRWERGLAEQDEQMAILVQRVSGDQHGGDFYPHVSGVGHSTNLYVWDQSIDMEAGMLRLVFGLGTRAVDRTAGDYARIVPLDMPERQPFVDPDDRRKFSQHAADVLSLTDNRLTTREAEELLRGDLKVDPGVFASVDHEAARRLAELGYRNVRTPLVPDFRWLLSRTEFPALMRGMMKLLSGLYECPVDIEFTANFTDERSFKVNLVQCRPLQTRGLGKPVKVPEVKREKDLFLATEGMFMGGNAHLPIDWVVLVRPDRYLELDQRKKYEIARQIGTINRALKGRRAMLVGPGRWGTSTPSLGVPVHFSEISHMSVLCEVASPAAGIMPEVSFGSHFFQDLVESGIFYAAIIEGMRGVRFRPEYVLEKENALPALLPDCSYAADVIHVAETRGLRLFADVVTQRLVCLEEAEEQPV